MNISLWTNATSASNESEQFPMCVPYLGPLNIAVIVIYATIFILSLIGNSMVIFTILNTPALRTVTNLFLLNLAASDLLLSVVCLPTTLFSVIFQCFFLGSAMCHIISYLQPVTVTASAHTLVIIAVERFYAIVKPFASLTFKTKSHSLIMVMGVWIVALLFNLPFAIFAHNFQITKNQYNCRIQFPPNFDKIFLPSLTLEILVIPCLGMIVCYSFVIRTLWADISVQTKSNFPNQRSTSPALSVDLHDTESIGSPKCKSHEVTHRAISRSGTAESFALSPLKRKMARAPLNTPSITPKKKGNSDSRQISFDFKQHPSTFRPTKSDSDVPNSLLKQALLKPFGLIRPHTSAIITVGPKRNCNITATATSMPIAVLECAVAQLRSTAGRRHLMAKRRLIKMLIVLVVEFFVCWAPFFIFSLMTSFGKIPWAEPWTYYVFSFIVILAYFSSCTNPATYCFMNSRFRNAFLSHFKCMCSRRWETKATIQNQTSAPNLYESPIRKAPHTIPNEANVTNRKQGSFLSKL